MSAIDWEKVWLPADVFVNGDVLLAFRRRIEDAVEAQLAAPDDKLAKVIARCREAEAEYGLRPPEERDEINRAFAAGYYSLAANILEEIGEGE